jgi:hypothetical protein
MKLVIQKGIFFLLGLILTQEAFSQAPSITYSPYLAVGSLFTITPSNSGGAIPATVYGQVTTIDPTTGTISGTPTTVTPTATYVVTAYNRGRTNTTSLDISVSAATAPQFNWTGAVSSDWSTGGNWGPGTIPGATDMAIIGLTPFTNQPTVGANLQAGQIILGGEAPVTLTVNTGFTLQVNGSVIQNNTPGKTASTTTLAGNGAMSCTAIVVGNAALPKIVKDKTTLMTSKIASLTISDSLVVNSSTIDLLSGALAHNNATFSLEGGLLTVGGRIKLDNFIPLYLDSLTGSKPLAKFVISTTSSLNATLSLSDTTVFKLVHAGLDSIDFYHYVTGTGKSTVIYSGANQLVYTNNAAGLDTTPYTYQNLSIAGSGTKTAGRDSTGNHLNVGGNLVITGGTLDLGTYKPVSVVSGNFNNTGSINFGTSTTTFNGTSFFNGGSFNVSTGAIQFSGGAQTLVDSTASGTNFRRVTFNHTGSKNIQSGKFAILSSGKIRLSDTANLNVTTGATLTLRADSTGAAAIAALISGCTVTGQLNVEQYIQGSLYLHNLSARGYRLLSSAVYTGIDSTSSAKVFDVNYMINSLTSSLTDVIIVSGLNGATNGFTNTPLNNPTIYLFREDCPPPPTSSTSFTTQYNWKGVAKINNAPVYNIGNQKFLTRTNTADTTTTIPVGNASLTFFRGNAILSNGSTTGTKLAAPVNYPEDVTMTQVGTPNTGDIKVRMWFANSTNDLGNHLSFTPANILHTTAKLRGGFALIGNPYPAPINWDNLSTSDSTSTIYGPNMLGSIYFFNPATSQYNLYMANPIHDRKQVYHGTGIATNIISSTYGFFAVVDTTSATPHAASLTFREPAKFDPDAGSSSGSFSALQNNNFLKIRVMAEPATQKQSSSSQPESTPSEPDREVRLKLIPVGDTIHNDDILISFRQGTTNSYNPKEDGYDLGGTEEAVTMLSSYSSDHVKLAINSLPLPAKTTSIELFTDAVNSGDFTLNAFSIKDIPTIYRVILKDNMTGRKTDLRKNNSYAFRIDKENKLSYGDRFELIIEKTGTIN